MPLPEGSAPPGCPPGLEYLTQIDQILVHQQIEIFECKNHVCVSVEHKHNILLHTSWTYRMSELPYRRSFASVYNYFIKTTHTVQQDTFEGENHHKFRGFVAVCESFLHKIFGHGIFWHHKRPIHVSFSAKFVFSTNSQKFSSSSFPLHDILYSKSHTRIYTGVSVLQVTSESVSYTVIKLSYSKMQSSYCTSWYMHTYTEWCDNHASCSTRHCHVNIEALTFSPIQWSDWSDYDVLVLSISAVMTGFETENKYRVCNTLGQQVYFASESKYVVCSFCNWVLQQPHSYTQVFIAYCNFQLGYERQDTVRYGRCWE